MMGPIDILYSWVLKSIFAYKWIELQVLKLFSGVIRRYAINTGEKLGIIFHFIENTKKSDIEFSKDEEQRVLAKCKYDKIIHLKIHNKNFFTRVFNTANVALGEGFMDGELDYTNSIDDITTALHRMLENNIYEVYYNPWNRFLNWLMLSAFNLQTPKRAWEVGKKHYDTGNDVFRATFGPWMLYTCAYWKDAKNLDEAQKHKMELIAKKLDLKPGMRVLDIGCGWGSMCKYLAENHGVSCVGVTISKEGQAYAKELCKGLDVDIRLQDYRQVNEKFDRIISAGMFEHVGFRNYKEYFTVARKCLVDDGIFLLHTMGYNHANFMPTEAWQHTYIFPNGCIPYFRDITKATEGLFIIEDWHNFGQDYAKTMLAWQANFIENWPNIEEKYGQTFFRMWTYFLSFFAAMFSSRRLQLWQIVLSKDGLQREYRAAR